MWTCRGISYREVRQAVGDRKFQRPAKVLGCEARADGSGPGAADRDCQWAETCPGHCYEFCIEEHVLSVEATNAKRGHPHPFLSGKTARFHISLAAFSWALASSCTSCHRAPFCFDCTSRPRKPRFLESWLWRSRRKEYFLWFVTRRRKLDVGSPLPPTSWDCQNHNQYNRMLTPRIKYMDRLLPLPVSHFDQSTLEYGPTSWDVALAKHAGGFWVDLQHRNKTNKYKNSYLSLLP